MLEHADFADAETLLERLQNSDRGVVFLVGSALTAPRAGGEPGVPGVEGVIGLIRDRYRSRPEPLARFEQALAADPSSRYQAAFRRLLDTHGQDAANAVIREAVLAARGPGTVDPRTSAQVLGGNREACRELEQDLAGWHLLPAVEALGRVIAGSPERFGQVVLTTNFDPLIEVSIRRAGGQVFLTVLHEDGSLEQTEAPGCRIVHLHGHWFRSDTLHTPVQLRQGRPKLHHSLAKLLGERTLVVVGYGGWDDIFARSLVDVVKGGLAQFDVLWTFYSGDSRQILEQHAKLLGDLESGMGRGRLRFYKGIDAHALFPALFSSLAAGPNAAASDPDLEWLRHWQQQGQDTRFGLGPGGALAGVYGSESEPGPMQSPGPPDVALFRSTRIQTEPPPRQVAEAKPGGRPASWPPPGLASPGDRLQAAFDRLEALLIAGASNEAVAQVREEIRAIRRETREGRSLQAGDMLSGRYRLVERVGVGGFAVVWKAIDRKNLDTVAVKILHAQHTDDRSRVERFYRGARTMARLNHQNIVRVIEPRAEDAGYYYFAMEFLAGGDFRQAVLAGSLSREQILRVIDDVGKALDYGHSQGIVHRDVKPQNILLGGDGSVRLTDFDLVHVADSTGGTRTGALGTFIYAPPEELTSGEADARGDIFSLGMSALFALYGKDLPWAALRDAAKFMAQIDCSHEIKVVLERAVRWERHERYPAMRAFCQALSEAAAQSAQGGTARQQPAQALPHAEAAPGPPAGEGAVRTFIMSSPMPADPKLAEASYRTMLAEAIDHTMTDAARPDHIVARNGLADLLRHQGRYGESETLYRSTMELAPDDLSARNGLAGVLFAQGRYGEAEALYRDTVHRFPDDVAARHGVAGVLAAQGRHGESEAYYRATLQRFPDDVTAKSGLEEVLKAQGR